MKPQTKTQTIPPALRAMSRVAFAKTRTERMLGEELNEFAVDKNGWTHLHWAAVANDAHSALRLLELGARPDSKNNGGADFGPEVKHRFAVLGLGDVEWGEGGETPLGVAMRVRAFSAASIMIARGADVNAHRGVVTPLHWAARHNAPEVAELLINNGADVNAKIGYDTMPLHEAAWSDARHVAELLINNGADVNAKTASGSMPLHWAARGKAPEVVELLISNGADVNAKDMFCRTPLHEAAWSDARHVAELLISNGADVNAKDSSCRTPLDTAAQNKAPEVVELLTNNGAKWRGGFRMRPECLLFSVLCCLHARPELGLGLEKLPPLLGTVDEAEAVESALSRLRFRASEGEDSEGEAEGGEMNVARWLEEDGFVGVARQVRESRRYADGGADPEEDFHHALKSLERRHAEKTGASKSAWLEKIRHDAEDDYEIPPLS